MEAMNQQVRVVSEELAAVKQEIINLKAMHAGLYQSGVESNQGTTRSIAEIAARIEELEGKSPTTAGDNRKPLIEPKQISVDVFSGGPSENRSKFMEWAEKSKDRIMLYDPDLVEIMGQTERSTKVIDHEASVRMGVSKQANKESIYF